MKRMKLSVKLISSFVIISIIGLAIGLIGTVNIRSIESKGLEMYEDNTVPLDSMAEIALIFQKMRGAVRDIMIDKYVAARDIKVHADNMKALNKLRLDYMTKFEKSIKSEELRKEFDVLKAEFNAYGPMRDKLLALIAEEKKDEAAEFMRNVVYAQADKIQAQMDKLRKMETEYAHQKSTENSETAKRALWISWVVTLIGVFGAVGLGVLLSLSITKPLKRVISGLAEGASQVASASSQISSSSQNLAEGASEQAATVEETSSSTEELAAMTKQNAANANEAKGMMSEARVIVDSVNTQMQHMVAAIGEITHTSEETSKIIKTIDEIAFQTNLLALNAAVEAARAGEAGAGFAVVADEVRNLAMRAAEAAKHTNDLIENTIKAVRKGNELTASTQEGFQKTVDISSKIGTLIDEIEAGSNEQAKGISQINSAVNEMNKVVQNNASNAEESASAAEEMNAQAENMKGFVSELALVVGGTGGGRNGYTESTRCSALSADMNPDKTLPALRRQASRGNGSRIVNPEQLIPMEKDGFKSF